MKRRGFLQVLGAAIAAPFVPKPAHGIRGTFIADYNCTVEAIEVVPVPGAKHRIYAPGRRVVSRVTRSTSPKRG